MYIMDVRSIYAHYSLLAIFSGVIEMSRTPESNRILWPQKPKLFVLDEIPSLWTLFQSHWQTFKNIY